MSKGQENSDDFPIGTLVYYGPDDQTVTKIVAGVLAARNAEIILNIWQGDGVVQNLSVIAEIGNFFQIHKVTKVVMTEGIAGCPHEEGLDYPVGDQCPFCPFWLDKHK